MKKGMGEKEKVGEGRRQAEPEAQLPGLMIGQSLGSVLTTAQAFPVGGNSEICFSLSALAACEAGYSRTVPGEPAPWSFGSLLSRFYLCPDS